MKRATGLLLSCLCFAFTAVADLHDSANSADYLIISSSDVIQQNEWIQNLADWRDDHGRVSMIVSTEEIFDEFGDGTPSDTTLKEFLHYARLNWSPPQLQYVFFIGHHDVVPSHVEEAHIGIESYLSDYFFATEFESDSLLPVLSIGRLPLLPDENSMLPDYYEKVVLYETAPDAIWQSRIHLIADISDTNFNFPEFDEFLALSIPTDFTIERDYLDSLEGNASHGDREEILDNWNLGNFLTIYYGYSGRASDSTWEMEVWSDSLQLDSAAFANLANGNRLPIAVGMQYDVSPDDYHVNAIPVSMLTNPDGGAIGYFAVSGVGWANNGRMYKRELVVQITSNTVRTLGDAWQRSTSSYRRLFPNSDLIEDSATRQTLFGTMLFGDPALRLPNRSTAADENPNPELPKSIALLGNYPNPFNSITTIKYTVPSAARISLTIYNVEGREVETLVDDLVNAGEHSVNWNASAQASGIYFAMLRSGSVTKTAKLVYLK